MTHRCAMHFYVSHVQAILRLRYVHIFLMKWKEKYNGLWISGWLGQLLLAGYTGLLHWSGSFMDARSSLFSSTDFITIFSSLV